MKNVLIQFYHKKRGAKSPSYIKPFQIQYFYSSATLGFGAFVEADEAGETGFGVSVTGAMIALWCWYRLMSRMPNPIGGILWIIVFAILATPTISEGPNSELAPAIFGLIFGVLTKEHVLIWSNLSLILFVLN